MLRQVSGKWTSKPERVENPRVSISYLLLDDESPFDHRSTVPALQQHVRTGLSGGKCPTSILHARSKPEVKRQVHVPFGNRDPLSMQGQLLAVLEKHHQVHLRRFLDGHQGIICDSQMAPAVF